MHVCLMQWELINISQYIIYVMCQMAIYFHHNNGNTNDFKLIIALTFMESLLHINMLKTTCNKYIGAIKG